MINTLSHSDKLISMFGEEDGLSTCRQVTFMITDACQFRCTYCYETNKSNHFMTNDTVKKCIDLLFKMYDEDKKDAFINKKTKSIILEFIGGEPLLAIDLLDYACSYFWNKCLENHHIWADTFFISLTSNGEAYFDERVQSFLKKFKDRLSFSISIDGDQKMHDSCRVRIDGSGTWEQANKAQMHYHKNYNGFLGTKATISPDNLQYFSNTVKYFIENNYQEVNANPIYEHEWTIDEAKLFYKELISTADYLLSLDFDIRGNIFNNKYLGLPKSENELMPYCGGSGLMLAFDYRGIAYPCIRYMESSLGTDRKPIIIGDYNGIYNTPEAQKLKETMAKITRRTQQDDECFYCPVGTGCGNCTAWCYQKYGTMDKFDKAICFMHKARVLANTYYWNKYYRKNNIEKRMEVLLPKEDALRFIDEEEYNKLIELSKM